MKTLKNVETLEIKEDVLNEINSMMEAYSEEGELYSEYGIEEDSNLYSFEKKFNNGYSGVINVNSGQCNCYIDYIFYSADGRQHSCVVGEDSLCDGDCIEFKADDEKYIIKIKKI